MFQSNDACTVTFFDGTTVILPKADVSYQQSCEYLLEVGMRVLAQFRASTTHDMPDGWYSGCIGVQAGPSNNHQYLVCHPFFIARKYKMIAAVLDFLRCPLFAIRRRG